MAVRSMFGVVNQKSWNISWDTDQLLRDLVFLGLLLLLSLHWFVLESRLFGFFQVKNFCFGRWRFLVGRSITLCWCFLKRWHTAGPLVTGQSSKPVRCWIPCQLSKHRRLQKNSLLSRGLNLGLHGFLRCGLMYDIKTLASYTRCQYRQKQSWLLHDASLFSIFLHHQLSYNSNNLRGDIGNSTKFNIICIFWHSTRPLLSFGMITFPSLVRYW